jgi:hypothetical protein
MTIEYFLFSVIIGMLFGDWWRMLYESKGGNKLIPFVIILFYIFSCHYIWYKVVGFK